MKSSTVFHIEFCTLSKTIFATILCHNKTVLHGLNLLVSLSKFSIDTTKNRWYRIDLKKLVSRISRSAYNHSTPILCHREILGSLQQMYQMPVSSRNEHVYGDTGCFLVYFLVPHKAH